MSDSYKGCTVAFEKDVSEEAFEEITQAILMIKGVLAVEGSVRDIDDYMNRQQVRNDLGHKLWDVLYPGDK